MGYKPCWQDPGHPKLGVFAFEDKQVVQIWIRVSHVEAVSVLVEFDNTPASEQQNDSISL